MPRCDSDNFAITGVGTSRRLAGDRVVSVIPLAFSHTLPVTQDETETLDAPPFPSSSPVRDLAFRPSRARSPSMNFFPVASPRSLARVVVARVAARRRASSVRKTPPV
jgi:hypothetical protein